MYKQEVIYSYFALRLLPFLTVFGSATGLQLHNRVLLKSPAIWKYMDQSWHYLSVSCRLVKTFAGSYSIRVHVPRWRIVGDRVRVRDRLVSRSFITARLLAIRGMAFFESLATHLNMTKTCFPWIMCYASLLLATSITAISLEIPFPCHKDMKTHGPTTKFHHF